MPRRKTWGFHPDSGGVKIPDDVKRRTEERIRRYAEENFEGRYNSLDIRFRGQFCYVDAYAEPDLTPDWPPKGWQETREEALERLRNTPMHLCRLRYFSEDRWSLAFFTYSNEQYTPCAFSSGDFFGTPEEGFDVGSTYLNVE